MARQPAEHPGPAVRTVLPGALLPALRRHACRDRPRLAHHVQRRLRHRELVHRTVRHRRSVLDLDARVRARRGELRRPVVVPRVLDDHPRRGPQGHPPELYEAAELDGASRWRQFRSVTVPLLSPSIFFVVIVTTISSFQLFDLLYAILGSTNPVIPKTMSLVFYFYSAGFIDNAKGFAAAIAMVIFLLIGIVTLVQFRVQRKWVQA
ncbi:carbohydrate ABC transporter permease [Curtobacterium sp. 24E2]